MTAIPERVVFVGPDPLPAMASGLPVICADGCGLSQAEGPGWEPFPATGSQSSATLLEQPSVQRRIRSLVDALVVWKSSAQVERVAQELGVVVANSPALIARRIENKSHFSRSAPGAGLPVPPTRTGIAGSELRQAARDLAHPLVFQLAHGFSGEQTYLAESEAELAELIQRFHGRSCRIAELVAGTPVTVTGVVATDRVLVGPACLQLTGLPSLTPHPMGSCGNDYGRPVPEADAVHQVALRAAEWLRLQGHLGIFGLDLVVGSPGAIWCIEINPRLVASVPLFSLSARDRGDPGILNCHLASLGIGQSSGPDLSCHWSQLILYQRAERISDQSVKTTKGTFGASGHFRSTGELGLAGPPPGEVGLLVQARSRPGRELARLFFEGPCCAADGTLLPHLEALVEELRSQLEVPGGPPDVS
ncbi:MAG: ATP-grasp domain-containing protein [Candidatus Dormiibacterota bacterium]